MDMDSPRHMNGILDQLQVLETELQLSIHHTTTKDSTFVLTKLQEQQIQELWHIVLDVVSSSLIVRIRAADIFSSCFSVDIFPMLIHCLPPIQKENVRALRSIVSTTCQVLEECNGTLKQGEEDISTWMAFFEMIVTQWPKKWKEFRLLHGISYRALLIKLLRQLPRCSTLLFAAMTMCLGALHHHEMHDENYIFVPEILSSSTIYEGQNEICNALLHVINSCSYPCATHRRIHLWNALELFGSILQEPMTKTKYLFLNDVKVFIDLILRQLVDLPLEHTTTILQLLHVLEQLVISPWYKAAHLYRKTDFMIYFQGILQAASRDTSAVPTSIVDKVQYLVVEYIDIWD